LRAAGIIVRCGVLEAECQELIRGFASVQRTGRPWIIAKLAMSLDGRLTRPPTESRWLSGPAARGEVQRLRAACDAILTSGETVRRDDPALTIRTPELAAGRDQPLRVILTRDPALLPVGAQLFTDDFANRTLVRSGTDLAGVMRELAADFGCCTVLLEAGGRLVGRCIEAGLVDELIVFLAPLVVGGEVPAIGPCGALRRLEHVAFQACGEDLMLRGVFGARPSA
jgi:diaminohydroxyphosphoribosylaminopyrimidine deaminase/5-amino-6-(5-phosphoribosylamino)uracil reductase